MKVLKKILIAIIVVIFLCMAMFEPSEPKGDLVPYMSDLSYIPNKVCAKGKVKKKMFYKSDYDSLGTYTLTAYCGCSRCCGRSSAKTSTGKTPKSKHTIAVDPRVIPYGTVLRINGIEYTAEDCGGAIKGKKIDIFFDTHREALNFGVQRAKVYKKKSPQLLFKIKVCRTKKLKELVIREVKSFGSKFKHRRIATKP